MDEQRAVDLVGQVDGRVTLQRRAAPSLIASVRSKNAAVSGFLRLTLRFWASTLAPASSRMWAASTFPASTAQCSGVFLFTLSTALREALFLTRNFVGSGLEGEARQVRTQPFRMVFVPIEGIKGVFSVSFLTQ